MSDQVTQVSEIDRATLIYMCQEHDREEAAQMGEPDPWDWEESEPDAQWVEERVVAMREACAALMRDYDLHPTGRKR